MICRLIKSVIADISYLWSRKQFGTVRSEFAYYVSRAFNRTVPAYRALVQFLKRTVPSFRTLVRCVFFSIVPSINLVEQRSIYDICDLY